tara:strand:- start:1378 stop:1599 length:222 start_codon:yes stop_codon:yes gene_type:complete
MKNLDKSKAESILRREVLLAKIKLDQVKSTWSDDDCDFILDEHRKTLADLQFVLRVLKGINLDDLATDYCNAN